MKTVKPGEYILIKVFLDETLDESEALAPEILFADFVRALREDYKVELVEEGESVPKDGVEAIIVAPGDPSVGIFSSTFEIRGGFNFEDKNEREWARKSLNETFDGITGDKCFVWFSDELTEKMGW